MRAIELGAALVATLIGLMGLCLAVLPDLAASELGPSGLIWRGGLGLPGLAVVGLGALYLVGLCLGAYLHAARGGAFGLGLLWACALSVLAVALLGVFSIGTSLLPAALVAISAAAAGTCHAESAEAAG
jgi:hypothetical protein